MSYSYWDTSALIKRYHQEKGSEIISSKIQNIAVLLILLTIIFFVGGTVINYYFSDDNSIVRWIAVILLSLVGVACICLTFILLTFIPLKKYLVKLVKPPYYINKIKISLFDNLIDVYKDNSFFCTIRVRTLAASVPWIIVPLNTPLSFFNISSRRIIGDGDKVIWVRLPKAITDLHTEFEDGEKRLVMDIDMDLLREKDDILPLVEHIRDEIESMKYSDEHLRTVHDEAVACRRFMKGHICTKCWELIPKSKLKDECPADGKPHETKLLLLDIHPPYKAATGKTSNFQAIAFVLLIVVQYIFLRKYIPEILWFLIFPIEGLAGVFILAYYFHKITTFKNMLKHFEVKKKFIMEQMMVEKEKEEYLNSENQ